MANLRPSTHLASRSSLAALIGIFMTTSVTLRAQEIPIVTKQTKATSIKKKIQADEGITNIEFIRNTSALIDRAVVEDLASQQLQPFPITDDAIFLRRAYIGITGRIPTYLEAYSFLQQSNPQKRIKLIDKLVYSPGYNSKMFNFWADMLRLKSTHEQSGLGWHLWLRDSVTKNKPYNTMVYEMLSARGHAAQNPAAGYYLRDRNMLLDNISNSAKVFLGTQIGCAQCHDDPFEDRTQKEYYQLAAFGANIDYKSNTAYKKIKQTAINIAHQNGVRKSTLNVNQAKNKKAKNNIKEQNKKFDKFIKQTHRDLYSVFKDFNKNEITYNNTKSLKLPNDYKYNDGNPGEVVTANPLFGSIPGLEQGPDKLENFAKWMTHPDNPQFTKNIANRLWKHVFGYGLAEPIDNWTDRTKVAHPEALAIVEKILRKNDYNIQETLRILYHTKLFQRSTSTVEAPQGSIYAFQGPVLRRLSAEELYDSYLTLEKGNIDNNHNHKLRQRWKTYQKSISYLINIKPQHLIELDKITDHNENSINELKAKQRELQIAKDTAIKLGNSEKTEEINSQRSALFTEINELKKKNAEILTARIPASSSMAQMTTMGNLHHSKNYKINELRASELPSPRNDDAFLRIFGSSDRQTSNAAQTDSSIPQTLSLLNGKQIHKLTDNKGEILELMRGGKTPREKLNVLFLGLYSRYPTAEEHVKFQPFISDKKQIRVLAKAMLNSKNFLFLQ